MGKLRWTLLIVGGLFIIALGLWERLRPRQARRPPRGRQVLEPRSGEQPPSESWAAKLPQEPLVAARSGAARTGPPEPWIGEPGLTEAVAPESALRDGVAQPRVPRASEVLPDNPDSVAAPPEVPPVLLIDEIDDTADESPTAELPVLPESALDIPAELSEAVGDLGLAEGIEAPRVPGTSPPESRLPAEPIVEWPPEDSRHIVALRLVAPAERFAGRALRQALAAEGFLLGKFDIFHKPDEAHRAVVSAASLTRPGTFDLETMDSQRYAGLNLFAVLPGPRPGREALDELVELAQNLRERLQGELQDARGEALTDESIERLRATLPASAGGGAAS